MRSREQKILNTPQTLHSQEHGAPGRHWMIRENMAGAAPLDTACANILGQFFCGDDVDKPGKPRLSGEKQDYNSSLLPEPFPRRTHQQPDPAHVEEISQPCVTTKEPSLSPMIPAPSPPLNRSASCSPSRRRGPLDSYLRQDASPGTSSRTVKKRLQTCASPQPRRTRLRTADALSQPAPPAE